MRCVLCYKVLGCLKTVDERERRNKRMIFGGEERDRGQSSTRGGYKIVSGIARADHGR